MLIAYPVPCSLEFGLILATSDLMMELRWVMTMEAASGDVAGLGWLAGFSHVRGLGCGAASHWPAQ